MELDEAKSHGHEGQLPSCDGCRARKLKCSREKPTCTNCTRLETECTYDASRSKPGLKRGTVSELSRRIENIERTLFGGDENDQEKSDKSSSVPSAHALPISTNQTSLDAGVTALSLLVQEIQKLNSKIFAVPPPTSPSAADSKAISTTPPTSANGTAVPLAHARKRRRADSTGSHSATSETNTSTDRNTDYSALFLTGHNLDLLLDAFFKNVHPWVPNIHQASFRRKLQRPDGIRDHTLILHAMLVGALRFIDPAAILCEANVINAAVEQSRNKVILECMTDLSVKALQALTIIAFTYIGDGQPLKAWPIVASMTRTVDFLQLSVEKEDKAYPESFLRPLNLPPPVDWLEEEERRRVFWNIFILDRFCSMTNGWNIGLTADNVSRRLPINGSNWTDENPAVAPLFGIWDKSDVKIGNSVAFLPAHYPSPGQLSDTSGGIHVEATTSSFGAQRLQPQAAQMDVSTIGAFAYFVECLESLCRINLYFLQPTIDFTNRQDVSNWLTRFKELDLRLVHWKMFLPAKWKDPNVPRECTTTALDPNMSLAHITHNTSMILLHQRIAYPEAKLRSIKLPNFHSAETCQSAAIETALSAVKYLELAPPHMPVSPHFCFCVYVSARVLIVHSRFYGFELDAQYWTLIDCLQDMSHRWIGSSQSHAEQLPLSEQFARHLKYLHERYHLEPDFSIAVVGPVVDHPIAKLAKTRNTGGGRHESSSARLSAGDAEPSCVHLPAVSTIELIGPPQLGQQYSPVAAALQNGAPIRPGAGVTESSVDSGNANWQSPSSTSDTWATGSAKGQDELSHIISTLTDQRFMDMDRVIAFNDYNFEPLGSSLPGAR